MNLNLARSCLFAILVFALVFATRHFLPLTHMTWYLFLRVFFTSDGQTEYRDYMHDQFWLGIEFGLCALLSGFGIWFLRENPKPNDKRRDA